MFDLENCQVPAVLAQAPAKGVSDRFTFIETRKVINDLESLGWIAVGAKGSTKPESMSAKHMVRFRSSENLEMPVNGVCPELIITNAHNGASSFILRAGLFRLVCSNGMIVSEAIFSSVRIRHINYSSEIIRDLVLEYSKRIPEITEKVKEFQAVILTDSLKLTFARMAVAARFENTPTVAQSIDLESLLIPTRAADKGNDLFSVLNILQEKLLNAGRFEIPGKRKPREIRNVQRIITLNQRLFDIAEAVGMLA